MLKKCNLLFVSLLLLITTIVATAQQSKEFEALKQQYPDDNYIRLQETTLITIAIKDGEIEITQEVEEQDMYLGDNASQGSKESKSFSYFFELASIEASAFNYKDGKYREEKVTDFKYKDQIEESFYDDAKSVNFIYNNLKKGSKTNLKYVEKVKNPRFLSPFYFANFYPVLSNSVTIVADNDINLRFVEFNLEGIPINFDKEVNRKTTTYTWQANAIDAFEYESNVPSFQRILPHIVPIISSYKVDDVAIPVLQDLSSLYSWYASLVKDVNTQPPSEDLKNIVTQLTAPLKTDFEKVKAIYYWTQKNIKYIAFEYALGGFIPREANDVFNQKYGDCKDNSSILKVMLDIAGIKGNLTWIGTRSIPYGYEEVPTPLVDNHMILSYNDGTTTYFLDATGRYTPIDMPTSFIQGKEALIENDAETYRIEKVPVVPSSKNQLKDTTTITIVDNDIKGSASTTFSGYVKVDIFRSLENSTTDNALKVLYKNVLEKGSNKFIVNTFEEKNKYDYEKDFEVAYDFSIDGQVRLLGEEMYLNLNLNKPLEYFKVEKDRNYEIEYDYKNEHHYTTTLSIPKGYTIDYLPENFEKSTPLISSKINYQLEGTTLTYHHNVIINYISLDVDQQKQVNDFVDTASKQYNEVIVLKKIAP